MKNKTFKIRFIKENDTYTLQIKNLFGLWVTQKEKVCSDGGCFKQTYNFKDKTVLLKYVILKDYWANRDSVIVEYSTIEKYKLW